jgi:glycosyltransferase involved in cell wall biosynthesis
MKVAALMPVRNEDWVFGFSARVALRWCDELIILDHASSDGTPILIEELEAEYPRRVTNVRTNDPVWHEMQHRQTLLDVARTRNATHIALVDADEILTGNLLPVIRNILNNFPHGAMLELPGYNVRGDLYRYHANGIWGERWFSLAFADDARLHWSGDRFHHRAPMGISWINWQAIEQQSGGILHLWGLNERRLIAKHALYKMTETLRWPNKSRQEIDRFYSQPFDPAMNRQFEQMWRYRTAPDSWYEPYQDLLGYLHRDRIPWQETYCQQLYEQHGAHRFAGLNLFGVCQAAALETI